MVLSVKAAANAGYYFQANGLEARPDLAGGKWIGSIKRFGVVEGSAVQPEIFQHLLMRRTPKGEAPTFDPATRSTGRDFVFSAPKSVSIVWAFAGADVRRKIEDAQFAAVTAAVNTLLKEACRERCGKGGAILRPAKGVAATFMHVATRRASHAGPDEKATTELIFPDPNLHTHAVVPDIVEAGSGRLKIGYTALHTHWSMAIGAWYHATLAYHLRREGFRLEAAGVNGLFRVADVSSEWIRAFSARTISSDCDRTGEHAPDEKQRSKRLRKTRPAFTPLEKQVEDQWKQHAQRRGLIRGDWGPEKGGPAPAIAPDRFRDLFEQATKDASATSAIMQKPDLFRAIASLIVKEDLNLLPTTEHVDRLVSSGLLVECAPSRSYGFPQWTAAANLAEENAVVSYARELSAAPTTPLPISPRAEALLAGLYPDQALIARDAISTGRLMVIAGPPGAGKTHLLEPVIRAFQSIGGDKSVIGASEAWQPALALNRAFGIPVYSLAQLLLPKSGPSIKVSRQTVLIVDEAGLLPTARMRALLKFVSETGAKLILVGDDGQLHPIGAGSGLRLVQREVRTHSLSNLIRMNDPAHLAVAQGFVALRQLGSVGDVHMIGRDGDIKRGLSFGQEGRDAFDTAHSLAEQMVKNGRWRAFEKSKDAIERVVAVLEDGIRAGHSKPTSIAVARSNKEAQRISRRLRERLRHRGLIGASDVKIDAVTPMRAPVTLHLAVGDRIRFLARRKSLGIYNGTLGIVRKIHALPKTQHGKQNHRITVDIEESSGSRTVRFLLSDFHDSEGRACITSGYVGTIYGCQGVTVDNVIVLKTATMNFRELYVATTRARNACEVVEVNGRRASDLASIETRKFAERSIARSIVVAARQDRPKSLALDHRVGSPCPSVAADRTPADIPKMVDPWIWQTVLDGAGNDRPFELMKSRRARRRVRLTAALSTQ